MTSLRETAAQCCKRVYIGAAVLPKPLFVPDHDENGDGEGVGVAAGRPRIKCGTVSTVDPDDDPTLSAVARDRPPTRYARVLASEFNAIVIEHHLKWSPLVYALPGPIHQSAPPTTRLGSYDFHHVDIMVDFAIKHDMHVKGHVLVWHVTSPPFLEDMSPGEVREAIRRHIYTTMAYFRGRITMWDVVNEALASDGTLVENVFYRKLGPTYIDQCFRWAHEADPDAFLIYNDNKVEGCGSCYHGRGYQGEGSDSNKNSTNGNTNDRRCLEENAIITKRMADGKLCKTKARAPNQAKADGFYYLLKDLVERGVPIHGAGMQAHFNAGGIKHQRPPTPSMVRRQIRRIGELGLKVNISEMDVRVSKLPVCEERPREIFSKGDANVNAVRELAQTEIYRDVLTAALSEPAFHGIWLWGFTDRHTWVKNFYYNDAPLIFNENYDKKASYNSVKMALKSLCSDRQLPSKFLEDDYDDEGNEWGHVWILPDPEEVGEGESDTTKDGQPDWLQPS